MMWNDRLPHALALAIGLLIFAGVVTFGGLIEKRRWALPAEALRVAAAIAVAVVFVRGGLR